MGWKCWCGLWLLIVCSVWVFCLMRFVWCCCLILVYGCMMNCWLCCGIRLMKLCCLNGVLCRIGSILRCWLMKLRISLKVRIVWVLCSGCLIGCVSRLVSCWSLFLWCGWCVSVCDWLYCVIYWLIGVVVICVVVCVLFFVEYFYDCICMMIFCIKGFFIVVLLMFGIGSVFVLMCDDMYLLICCLDIFDLLVDIVV